MLAQPPLKFVGPQPAGFVEGDQEREGFDVIEFQEISVHLQEGRRYRNRDALVAMNG
jgi:hypothetical protein